MRVVYERCCGLDVHKRTVVACALTPEGKQIRTFSTMTKDGDNREVSDARWHGNHFPESLASLSRSCPIVRPWSSN